MPSSAPDESRWSTNGGVAPRKASPARADAAPGMPWGSLFLVEESLDLGPEGFLRRLLAVDDDDPDVALEVDGRDVLLFHAGVVASRPENRLGLDRLIHGDELVAGH